MFSKVFWRDAAERAIKTFAQTLAALLSATATPLLAFDWPVLLGVAATAALLSLLTSVGSARTTSETLTPASLVKDTSESV